MTAEFEVESIRLVKGGPFGKPVWPFTPVFRPPHNPAAVTLRTQYRLMEVAGDGGDFDRARRLKSWVRSQWNHGWDNEGQQDALDILSRAAKGGAFHCFYYSQTFAQCCLAVGLPARLMGIYRHEADFPDAIYNNESHAVAEVYCRDLGKWVVFDTDGNCFYTIDGVPANSLEVHRAWHRNGGSRVRQVLDDPPFVTPTHCPFIPDETLARIFEDLARHQTKDYYYRIATRVVQGFTVPPAATPDVQLWFTGEIPPLLANHYAGINTQDVLLVSEEDLFNWPLDRIGISTLRMGGEAPTNRLELQLNHAMPFFDHFEYRLEEGASVRLPEDRLSLALPPGRSTIHLNGMDCFDKPGHEAVLTIETVPASAGLLAHRRQLIQTPMK